ncbi:lipoate--protein ligase family protein [Candidatus Micrarchaeota archaeon]|nr:lipoate--protein ligase family protein [Candidatus Micrarchaeota archaeon]
MALDEAMLVETQENEKLVPSLRLYSWKPACVTIGYFQCLREEVDVSKCKELGVDVVRRQTGGGAVFHDAELTYSFITRDYPLGILDSYKLVCGAILSGLKTIGIDGQFVPLNDLIAGGKKFSGNAQTRKKGVLLQHGTILLDVDAEKMFSLLLVPNEKIRDKMIASVKERVTGVGKGSDDVAGALKKGFSETFQAELVASNVSKHEEAETKKFIEEKYGNGKWNEMR